MRGGAVMTDVSVIRGYLRAPPPAVNCFVDPTDRTTRDTPKNLTAEIAEESRGTKGFSFPPRNSAPPAVILLVDPIVASARQLLKNLTAEIAEDADVRASSTRRRLPGGSRPCATNTTGTICGAGVPPADRQTSTVAFSSATLRLRVNQTEIPDALPSLFSSNPVVDSGFAQR